MQLLGKETRSTIWNWTSLETGRSNLAVSSVRRTSIGRAM